MQYPVIYKHWNTILIEICTPCIFSVTPLVLKHTDLMSRKDSMAIICIAIRNITVQNVTSVKDWHHSRNLLGKSTINLINFLRSPINFPPKAWAG